MGVLEVIERVIEKEVLNGTDFQWCFINEKKAPMKSNGTFAKPNTKRDFVSLYTLIEKVKDLSLFKGIGFSINFSKVSAIDIDKCVSTPFDITTINQLGKDLLKMFKDYYCEFSFSGTGLRIILKANIEEGYQEKYYIKNSTHNIEFYDHTFPARYVTMTGKSIHNNALKEVDEDLMKLFLDTYMKRTKKTVEIKSPSIIDKDVIRKKMKLLLLKNSRFQNIYFSKAPGSGKNESELDYFLIATIYEEVTRDKELIKEFLEKSEYYDSKDLKHKRKWDKTNYVETTIKKMS